jgi:dipeptidyl aminopeptidase/acylaminoacyl peptidase
MVSMFGEGDIPHFDVFEMGGTPWDEPETYRFRSPVTYLASVKTPVLLLHWEGDLRCPIGQSEEVFQGLKMLGKEVEFVRYPGGSHGGRTPSQAVDHIKRTLAWYNSHAPRKRAAKHRAKAAASTNGARRTNRRVARKRVLAEARR